MLDIRLLGTPRILLNDEPIIVTRKTTRSLLFYLAMQPNWVDRNTLAELLGDEETDEAKKRKTLRRYLNHLRNIDKDLELIQTYHDTIRLNPELVRVDALFVLDIAVEAQKYKGFHHAADHTLPLALYQKAQARAASLNGDIFIDSTDLDGFVELSQWKTEEDARLRNAQGTLFTFLADMASRLGRLESAYTWAEQAWKFSDSDDVQYILLKSLRDMGKFAKARDHYLEFQEMFESDLSKRVQTLGEEILNIGEASPLYARPVWAVRPSVSAPFVGQKNILQRMQMNYQRGVGTLLVSEAGFGKTRLAQEFYESLPLAPNLLQVTCYQDNENLSYLPWINMLRQSFDREFWKTTPVRWTSPLTMLLPELHDYRNDLDSKPGDSFANALVFEAMKNLLQYANQKRSALLFVEDAQWMDRVSFDLLKYLIVQATFKQWNVGLLVTSRLGIQTGVERFELDEMVGKLDEIELEPLKQEDIKFLTFYVLDEILPDERIDYLQKLTGGNPFFLLELLSFHITYAGVDIFEPSALAPPSLKQLIDTRLRTLTPLARKALNYAAIQGYQFVLSVLEEALEVPMDEMAVVIAELEDARLVQFMRKDADLFYIFRHDKIREEIISALPAAELRLMHARLAEVLSQKKVYQSEYVAVLAEHYEGAGKFKDAFGAWHRAAKHANRIFSLRDSQAAFLRAEKLIPHVDLVDEDIYRFYMSWDLMLFSRDQHDELEVVMERLLDLGEKRGSHLLIGAALDGMSNVSLLRNQYQRGLKSVEDAMAYFKMETHIPALMNAFIHQGVFQYMLNDFPASLKSFRKVLSLDEESPDHHPKHILGLAHHQMAVSLTGMGYPIRAIEHGRQSLHYMRISNVPHATIQPHNLMALANYYIGEYSEGQKHALRSIQLARVSGSWRLFGYAATYAGMNETELPELGNAWQHAQNAIAYGEKYGHTMIVSLGYKIIGDIYTRLESPTKAVKAYQSGLAVDKASFASVENAARLGVTLGLLGDPRADATLEEALIRARAAGLEIIEINARALQLSLFVQRENHAAFDANVNEILANLTERSNAKSFVWIDYLQAIRFYQQGKLEEALALLEKTLPVLDELLFFWIRFRAHKLHFSLLNALGRDPAEPRARLDEMLAQIEAGLGNAPLQEEWMIFSERIKAL